MTHLFEIWLEWIFQPSHHCSYIFECWSALICTLQVAGHQCENDLICNFQHYKNVLQNIWLQKYIIACHNHLFGLDVKSTLMPHLYIYLLLILRTPIVYVKEAIVQIWFHIQILYYSIYMYVLVKWAYLSASNPHK